MTATTQTVQAWRLFSATVSAVQRLSPSFVRVTFASPDLMQLGDDRDDQRIKLILPAPDGSLDIVDSDDLHWYQELMSREDSRRNPVRTYTSRYVRADAGEVDVDFVLHGDEGPASRWAGAVAVGDEIMICGPNLAHGGPYGGTGFRPAAGTSQFLLVADETAVPAALAILEGLEGLEETVTGAALLEVPHVGDELAVTAPAGVQVRWLPREEAPQGSLLEPAALALLDQWLGSSVAPGGEHADLPVDPDGILWDVPEAAEGEFYAWLAGEAGVVTRLRRELVRGRGVDRRSVAFMGYWRAGKPES